MTITVFAMATTGLPVPHAGPEDPNQPRMVSLSAMLISGKWEERAAFHCLISPEGSVSAAEAEHIHGISERERELYGMEPRLAMANLMRFFRRSEECVTFNMAFARKLIEIELHRLNASAEDWMRGGFKKHCLLEEAGHVHNAGRIMKIAAAHEAVTGLAYDPPPKNKHMYDVRAALRVVQGLRS